MKKLMLLISLVFSFWASQAQTGVPISFLPVYQGNPSGSWVPIVVGNTTRKIDAKFFGYNSFDSLKIVYGNTVDTFKYYNRSSGTFFYIPYTHAPAGGFDSLTSQGGGFHTLPFYDVRYLNRADSSNTNPNGFTTQASRQKLSDSLQALIVLKKNSNDSLASTPSGFVTQASRQKLSDSIIGLLANYMINYGNAPGWLVGTYATIPAATSYNPGTHFTAKDSGFIYIDTGLLATRGWKKISGGNTQTVNAVVNFLNSQQLGYGVYSSKPSTGTAFYYATDSAIWLYVNSGTATKLLSVVTSGSVTGTGVSTSPVQLQNDNASPGLNKVYGTDGTGTKGWQPAVTGGGSPAAYTGAIQINKLGSFGNTRRLDGDTLTGLLHMQKAAIADTLMKTQLGTIVTDNFNRSSIGSNWTLTNPNFTVTFPSSAYMHVTGSYSGFTNYAEWNQASCFNQDTIQVTVIFEDTASASYGMGIAQVSTNTYYARSALMQFSAASSGTKGKAIYYLGTTTFTTASLTSATTLPLTLLDTVDIKFARNDSVATLIAYNRRTATTQTNTYAYLSNNVNVTPPAQLPNTGKWRIYFFGGTFDILNFTVKSPDILGGIGFLHNSIGNGYNQTNWSGAYPNRLYPNNRQLFFKMGGPGDRLQDALVDTGYFFLHLPKKGYLQIVENDAAAGTSTTTFSTGVQAFITSCRYHGCLPILINGAPIKAASVKPFNDTLDAIGARLNVSVLHIYDSLKGPSTSYNPIYTSDSTHPNDLGTTVMTRQLVNQDTSFSYSTLRMDNLLPFVATDAGLKRLLWNPNKGIVAGANFGDSAIYFHQTPSVQDSGTISTTGALHIGSKPESTLLDAASWVAANGQSVSQIFAVRGLGAGDYPGMEIVDYLGNKTGFFYAANGGASFNPGYLLVESNVSNKGIRMIGGLGTGRGSDYDVEIDSAQLKINHGVQIPNIGTKLFDSTNYKLLLWDASGNVYKGYWGWLYNAVGAAITSVQSGTTLTLDNTANVWVFSGSSATTWTLPAVSGNTNLSYRIKNRGTAAITLQRAGSDNLYTTSSVISLTINPGEGYILVDDGSFWLVF